MVKITAVGKEMRAGGDNFHELPYSAPGTEIVCNREGTRIAVIRMEPLSEDISFRFGTSLEIWSLNETLQPKTLLFQERPGIFVSQAIWRGNYLLYNSIVGFNSLGQYANVIKARDFQKLATEHYQLRIWPGEMGRSKIVRNTVGMELFPHSDEGKLLVFDPFDEVLQQGDRKRFKDNYFHERVIQVWQVPDGRLLQNVASPLYPIERLTTGAPRVIPLFVSTDGSYLLAATSSDVPWRKRHSQQGDVPYLVAIDLKNGRVRPITSSKERDALRIEEWRFHSCNLPMAVEGGNVVVCLLDTFRLNDPLLYRFAYYTPTGILVREKRISARDLARVEPSWKQHPPFLITWVPDGKNILMQRGSQVWVVDTDKWQGQVLAEGVWVEDVFQWVRGRHLLVRVKKGLNTLTEKETHWGFLSLPVQ